LEEGVKRAVRQRCGFGCVICGSPVYDYDHIRGYATTGHDADWITLLCPEHHREKTAGRMPQAVAEEANRNPHNKSTDSGKAMPLYFSGAVFSVEFGSVCVRHTLEAGAARSTCILVDGMTVVGVRRVEHRILVTANLRDSDNQPVLTIRDGELRHSTAVWDVVTEGQGLKIRQAEGDIYLEMRFLPPDRVVISRAKMWANGVLIEVTRDGDLRFENSQNVFRRGTFVQGGFKVGLDISERSGVLLQLPDPPRFLGGLPEGGLPVLKRWRLDLK